jgi:hypothetical protein
MCVCVCIQACECARSNTTTNTGMCSRWRSRALSLLLTRVCALSCTRTRSLFSPPRVRRREWFSSLFMKFDAWPLGSILAHRHRLGTARVRTFPRNRLLLRERERERERESARARERAREKAQHTHQWCKRQGEARPASISAALALVSAHQSTILKSTHRYHQQYVDRHNHPHTHTY